MIQAIKLGTDQTPEKRLVLQSHATRVPSNGTIVEIGTGAGGTALTLRQSALASVNIYTIDPFAPPGLAKALEQAAIQLVPATSEHAARNWNGQPIHLLFVDGGHTFRDIIADLEAWLPLLAANAAIVFDDYGTAKAGGRGNVAVRVALDGLMETGLLKMVAQQCGLLVAEQNERSSIDESDIEACYRQYQRLRESRNNTFVGHCHRLANSMPQQFWELYGNANDPEKFRKAIGAYTMLEHGHVGSDWPSKIPMAPMQETAIMFLSRQLALEQVKLDLLWEAYKAVIGEKE